MQGTIIVTAVLGALTASAHLIADEGMLALNPPNVQTLRKQLQGKHGFDLTDAWLQRPCAPRCASNNGGSGSFVSPDGLVVTTTTSAPTPPETQPPGKSYYRDGYYAKTRDQELRCPTWN